MQVSQKIWNNNAQIFYSKKVLNWFVICINGGHDKQPWNHHQIFLTDQSFFLCQKSFEVVAKWIMIFNGDVAAIHSGNVDYDS